MTASRPMAINSSPWDVVVIGAGAAGLMACLELPSQCKVLLLNRNTSQRSSSRWAQGGIAAVTRLEDSFQQHAQDTLRAGAGICDADAVKMLVREAPQCVQHLLQLGMEFDKDNDGLLATTLEAAHSFRRVLHVQDRTGRALVEVLQDQIEQRSNIFHQRGVRVTQLLVEDNCCYGVQVLDGPLLHWIPARAVVLATGGGGHLFSNTTNPAQASGEGVALAWRAGAKIQDLEFVQFHPTALQLEGAPCFLISEAIRGEGAVLVDRHGESPVAHLSGKDLAPRDEVSRALFKTMKNQGTKNIGLDLKTIGLANAEIRFPTILQRCRELGLDPVNQVIPVAPAAHYWMGGVATNLKAETTVHGLYAVGEVACTGVHGANRLASNSLMECLVFARQMASINFMNPSRKFTENLQKHSEKCSVQLTEKFNHEILSCAIDSLRNVMWREAGVDRSVIGMQQAVKNLRKNFEDLNQEPLLQFVRTQQYGQCNFFDEDLRRDVNLLLDLNHRQMTSLLMLEACLFRKESRGGHFRNDFPCPLPYWERHSIQKFGEEISTSTIKN